MSCRVLVVLCVGFAAADVCSQQGGECRISNPSLTVSLLALNSVVEPSFLKLGEEVSAGSSTAAQGLANLHAATSEQRRTAWEAANHALRDVKEQESAMLLARNSSKHASAAAKYDQQAGEVENETSCRACADAEQGIIDALTTAREGHITAQNMAVTLAAASKGHEEAGSTFDTHHKAFVEAKKEMDSLLLTYTSTKAEFDALVSKAQSLHPAAQLAWQAQLDIDAKKNRMEDAQKAYDHAAEAALLLDADVTPKTRAEEEACAAIGLVTSPPTPAPQPAGPQLCDNKADCLAKGWKLMWTGGDAKSVLPLGESTMIGYMMPNGELLHAWHFKTPVSWKTEHPMDLFYDLTPDLEVTRLSDGLKYTGELVSSYGNYGGGCECGRGGGSWGRICLRRQDASIGCGKQESRVPVEIDFPYLRAYGRGVQTSNCGLSHYNWNAGPNSCGYNADFVILSTPA